MSRVKPINGYGVKDSCRQSGTYECNARSSIIMMMTGKSDYSAFEMETECSNDVSKTGWCLFSTESVCG